MPPKAEPRASRKALVNGGPSGAPKAGGNSESSAAGASTTRPPLTSGHAAPEEAAAAGTSKPDKPAYDKEQERLKVEIDAVTKKLNAVRTKIDAGKGTGPGAERRKELWAELDGLRSAQGNVKANRSKVLDQVKALQESATARAKALQAAKSKGQFKTLEEVDAHLRDLERQVDSGKLTLAGEKRAISDISAAKRLRKTVEGYKTEQDAIDADRSKADELKKQLDNPEAIAMSERFDALKAELDTLKAADDEAQQKRNKLYDEMRELKAQVDELWTQKKDSVKTYREAGDRYYKKVQEERARRQERFAAERKAAENAKRTEIALKLREEAGVPAYQADIEDCQTLIDALNARIGNGPAPSPSSAPNGTKSDIVGVPKLEPRTIEAPEGMVARKKKGGDESSYFVAKKKTSATASSSSNGKATVVPVDGTTPAAEAKLNLPYSTLSALLNLSIPPPVSLSDVPRTIEDLKTKKAWFEANQAHATAVNIAKADAEIKRLEQANADLNGIPNGNAGEYPIEPLPTPAHYEATSSTVPSPEVVADKLEEVKEVDVEA